jgi:maltooligosyltrehalose trehalohydrolase
VTDFDLGPRPADRFVTALQNHDQIGNRATGDRLSHLTTVDRYLVGVTLALTAPTVPMLFQGEEWASCSPFLFFADHDDPELRAAVHDGRLAEFVAFGWDPSAVPDPGDPSSFLRSKLDWDARLDEDHERVLDHYRTVLRLRREHGSLHDGRLVTDAEVDGERQAIVIVRGPLFVAANLGAAAVDIATTGAIEVLIGTGPLVAGRPGALRLGPDSAVVARGRPARSAIVGVTDGAAPVR